MATSKYTPEMVEALKAKGSFTYAEAKEFADASNLSIRSVVAKIRALEIPYTPKPVEEKVTPAVKPRRKSEVVKSVQSALNVAIPSLEKMTLADLETLEASIASFLFTEGYNG